MPDPSATVTARATTPEAATSPEPPSHPADAPVGVRALLTGPPTGGRVLAAFPHAVYVAVSDGDVVAVVTSDGIRLPNALVIRPPAAAAPFGAVAPGARAEVGAGALVIAGALRTHVGRWTDRRLRVPPTDLDAVGEGAARLTAALGRGGADGAAVEARLRAPRDRLVAALTAGDRAAARSAAESLVGVGAGLTPAGDDVLAGVLAAGGVLAAAVGDAATAAALADLGRHATALAVTRTTALSAALLRHACRGELAAPAAAVVRAVAAGAAPDGPVAALLAVGHSSGRDLASGISAGVEVITARPRPAAVPGATR